VNLEGDTIAFPLFFSFMERERADIGLGFNSSASAQASLADLMRT
jgi:hypothetical protein